MYSIMHGHPNCQVTILYHTILALITVATDPQLPWPSPWPSTYIMPRMASTLHPTPTLYGIPHRKLSLWRKYWCAFIS